MLEKRNTQKSFSKRPQSAAEGRRAILFAPTVSNREVEKKGRTMHSVYVQEVRHGLEEGGSLQQALHPAHQLWGSHRITAGQLRRLTAGGSKVHVQSLCGAGELVLGIQLNSIVG